MTRVAISPVYYYVLMNILVFLFAILTARLKKHSAVLARPGLFDEMVAGCAQTATFLTHPADLVNKAFRDINDFLEFPDKSKLAQKPYTRAQVSAYDGEQGRPLYIVVDGLVYDITAFADFHPAGPAPLQAHAGRDATTAIRLSGMPRALLDLAIQRFRVGYIVPE